MAVRCPVYSVGVAYQVAVFGLEIEDSTNLIDFRFVFPYKNHGRKGLSLRLECNIGLYQFSVLVADNTFVLPRFARVLYGHKCTQLICNRYNILINMITLQTYLISAKSTIFEPTPAQLSEKQRRSIPPVHHRWVVLLQTHFLEECEYEN